MRNLIFTSIVAFFLMQNVSSAQKTKKQTTPQPKKIYEAKSLEFILDKDAQVLTVRAHGETNTAGWTNATLKPAFSADKSDDGIYKFDFVAAPPRSDENVAQVITPVTAEYIFKPIPDNLKSVVVNAEKNKAEKRFAEITAHSSHINMSCDEGKKGTLVFNTGGSYRIVLQRLEMGDRSDAGFCIEGSKTCWEHLQMFSVGSAIEIDNVYAGSSLTVHSKQKKGDSPINIVMNELSCPPKEGFVYFEDSKGFRMQLKIEQTEALTLN